MESSSLLPGLEAALIPPHPEAPAQPQVHAAPRLRQPNRAQMLMRTCVLEELLEADHPARTIWEVTGRLDLSGFYEPIAARGPTPGRSATDPRLLVALWLYALTQGVGNGREVARLCEEHDAYRWLCGGLSVNYHTLNDFRTGHDQALDTLFTQVLATLMDQKLVQVQRISQDGTKVRASAGTGSFRRRPRLERLLEQARAHVAALKTQTDAPPGPSARSKAARERAARERQARIEAALAQMPQLEAIKAAQRPNRPSSRRAPRASTTDPEARTMRMAGGGFAPAYNVQIATDPQSRAIVGITVTNHGTDYGQEAPLREQVHQRTGVEVKEQLVDGGYVRKEAIETAQAQGVALFAPLPTTDGQEEAQPKPSQDSPAVAAWRERMTSPEGRETYKQRAATSETVNADLKTFRGLASFTVRGLKKVRCMALWSALAYNLMHFASTWQA